MADIGLRQVEAVDRQSRPGLLDEIKEAPGAAADIDEPQFALVASGESFRSGGSACRRMALAVPLNSTSTWVS